MTETEFALALNSLHSHRNNASGLRQLQHLTSFLSRHFQSIRAAEGSYNPRINLIGASMTNYSHAGLPLQHSQNRSRNFDEGLGFLAADISIEPFEGDDVEETVPYSTSTRADPLETRQQNHRNNQTWLADSQSLGLDQVSEYLYNGRSFYEVDESCLETENTGLLVSHNPAELYNDLLDLRQLSVQQLDGLHDSLPFKNNLLVFMDDNDLDDPLLVVACESSLLFYSALPHDATSTNRSHTPLFRFDSRPLSTSPNDLRAAVSHSNPHTINYLKYDSSWMDYSVLAACTDDGRILIWRCNLLYDKIRQFEINQRPRSTYYGVRVVQDYELRLGSSCWCVDFATCADNQGSYHHAAVGSCNDHLVKLFYYSSEEDSFKTIESFSMNHNVPEVSVLEYLIDGNNHEVYVCIACISGDVFTAVFRFDPKNFKNARCERLLKAKLHSDCWTAKPIADRYFLPVNSFRALTGAHYRDEQILEAALEVESRILNQKSGEVSLASKIQKFHVPSLYWIGGLASFDEVDQVTVKEDDSYKMKQILHSELVENVQMMFLDVHIVVSTPKEVALLRGDSLLCQASSGALFDFEEHKCQNDMGWSDRISISHLIPELLVLVLATQAGLLTIMRLCHYNGNHAMRQEYLLPGPASQLNLSRTILGVTSRDISVLTQIPRFLLCVTFSDGKAAVYELAQRQKTECSSIAQLDV